MFTETFWLESAERAVKSFAQSVILAWGIGDAVLNLFTADWLVMLQMGLSGAVLSVLTSLVSAPFGEPKGSPSLV